MGSVPETDFDETIPDVMEPGDCHRGSGYRYGVFSPKAHNHGQDQYLQGTNPVLSSMTHHPDPTASTFGQVTLDYQFQDVSTRRSLIV